LWFAKMRFGKKLALQVMDDQSGAPYLSHKPMKEAINRTVRELRLLQAATQGNGDAGANMAALTPAGLAELEERVASLDHQLFVLVDEDLERIIKHIRVGEAQLSSRIVQFQDLAKDAGLLVGEAQLSRLERILPCKLEDNSALCRNLLALKIHNDPMGTAQQLQDLSARFNDMADMANQHAQYMEINVAGFRKLLKRHEKQIPQRFRARHMPCLGFHRLVTRTTRQLLEIVRQLGTMLNDAWQRLPAVVAGVKAGSKSKTGSDIAVASTKLPQRPEFQEPTGLGPECEMVLHIQKQLKQPRNNQIMQLTGLALTPAPGMLYPKPGIQSRPSNSGNQEQQRPHQQQHQQPHQHHNQNNTNATKNTKNAVSNNSLYMMDQQFVGEQQVYEQDDQRFMFSHPPLNLDSNMTSGLTWQAGAGLPLQVDTVQSDAWQMWRDQTLQ